MTRNFNTFQGSRSFGFNSEFAEQFDGPIVYVGGNIASYATTNNIYHPLTNLTGGIDTRPRVNDFVVIWSSAAMPTMGNYQAPSGYESGNGSATSTSGVDTAIRFSRKIFTYEEEFAEIIGGTLGGGYGGIVGAQVFRRVKELGYGFPNTQTNSLDVATQIFQTTNAGSITVAMGGSITPVTSGAVILVGASAGHTRGYRENSGMDGSLNNVMTLGTNTTNDCSMSFGWRYWFQGDGPYTNGSFTFGTSAADQSWAAMRAVLRPQYPS